VFDISAGKTTTTSTASVLGGARVRPLRRQSDQSENAPNGHGFSDERRRWWIVADEIAAELVNFERPPAADATVEYHDGHGSRQRNRKRSLVRFEFPLRLGCEQRRRQQLGIVGQKWRWQQRAARISIIGGSQTESISVAVVQQSKRLRFSGALVTCITAGSSSIVNSSSRPAGSQALEPNHRWQQQQMGFSASFECVSRCPHIYRRLVSSSFGDFFFENVTGSRGGGSCFIV
jgi:hypothetical protein